MSGEKKQFQRKVRVGDISVLVKEILTGAHQGSFRVQGREDGTWKIFGVYKDQAKAIKMAKERAKAANITNRRILTLSDDEIHFCLAALDSGMTMEDVDRFKERYENSSTITLAAAADEWIEQKEKQDYSSKHLTDMRFLRTGLTQCFGEQRMVSSIDNFDLIEWFDTLTQGSKRRKNIRGVCVTFWKWLSVSRNYSAENFASKIEVPRIEKRSAAHAVLLPTEFSLMLEKVSTDFLPWLVIGGFAGVRTSEICGVPGRMSDRLKWSDFDWVNRRISIRPETSKTSDQRFTPISDALFEWTKPWHKSGGFVHTTYFPYSDNRKPRPMTTELGEFTGGWRPNCLRASRASYRLAETNNLSQTALEDGHTEYILRKNYLNPRFAEDATLWFALTPEKVKELNEKRIVSIKPKTA